MNKIYDLAIIGAGPGGYVAAERAAAGGLKTIIFEKEELGGVCLNEGCIPTKALLYCAKVFNYSQSSDHYGVLSEGASFDYGKFAARKDKVVRKLVAGVKAAMKSAEIEVIRKEAFISGRSEEGFRITADEQEFTASKLLVCTGSSAVVPPIPGLEQAGDTVMTNREILTLTQAPSDLVIIGGGVIGMEFASLFNTLGTRVTVIEMMPKILGPLDKEISEMLQKQYAKRGVDFRLGCKVTAIEGNDVVCFDPEGKEFRVSGERILLSVGRRANLTGFGLENIGVETSRQGIKVDSHMRTNVPGVYAAGDVTGFSMLAHTASREGEVAVADMLGKEDHMSYDAIPGVVYTNPEVAGVGLTEEGAMASGLDFTVLKLPMGYSGRFVAENERGEGLCKLIVGSDRKILGAHLLGNPCSEIIGCLCMAITMGISIDDLKKTVFPHPSVSEIIKETSFTI